MYAKILKHIVMILEFEYLFRSSKSISVTAKAPSTHKYSVHQTRLKKYIELAFQTDHFCESMLFLINHGRPIFPTDWWTRALILNHDALLPKHFSFSPKLYGTAIICHQSFWKPKGGILRWTVLKNVNWNFF